MKKIFTVITLFLCLNASNASFVIEKEKTSTQQQTTNSSPELEKRNAVRAQRLEKAKHNKALMEEVVQMSVQEYESMTGRKMSFTDKITFKVIKRQFENKLRKADYGDSEGFNIGGFILGLLLGLIGVLGAYIFSKDRNFRKWTWIGWGVFVAVYLIVLLVF